MQEIWREIKDYEELYQISNLGNVIPLCKMHHDLVHTNKKKYMPKLIKMIDEKLQKENN